MVQDTSTQGEESFLNNTTQKDNKVALQVGNL